MYEFTKAQRITKVKVHYIFEPRPCPECGKMFIPAPMHVYKNGLDDLVCTYTCMLKARRREEAEEAEKEAKKKAELTAKYKERAAVIKEAKKYGFKNSRGRITAKVAIEAKEFLDEVRRRENESKILSKDATGRST